MKSPDKNSSGVKITFRGDDLAILGKISSTLKKLEHRDNSYFTCFLPCDFYRIIFVLDQADISYETSINQDFSLSFTLTPKFLLRDYQKQALDKWFEKESRGTLILPTGSGKTLVAELAMLDTILNKNKRVIYIVPLKALASEKYKEFKELYDEKFKIRIAIGEIQNEKYNYNYDLLLVTAEKLDSLIRHDKSILDELGLVITDEIHLLNDEKRGPTLEILLSSFCTSSIQPISTLINTNAKGIIHHPKIYSYLLI